MKQFFSSPTRRKIAFAAALTVAALLLASVVFLVPLNNKTNALRRELADDERRIAAIQSFVAAHKDIDEYHRSLVKADELLDGLLPEDEQVGLVIAEWERLAGVCGVQLQQMQPQSGVERDGYTEWPVRLNIRGSFIPVLTYIKALEDSRRFTAVRQFSVKYTGQTDRQMAVLDATITASVFSCTAAR